MPRERLKIIIMERWVQYPDTYFDAILDFAELPRQTLQKHLEHARYYPVEPMGEEARTFLTETYRRSNERVFEVLGESIDEWRLA